MNKILTTKNHLSNTKFDAWWKKNWKTLFGYKQRETERETEPLYPLSKAPSGKTTRPQPEGIRFVLMVYELKDRPLLDGNDLTDTENEGNEMMGFPAVWNFEAKWAGDEPESKDEAAE
jgi:hypothetical protein